MRLGIFGGSFDPVHFGHLLLAEACREACQLDRVWFLAAAVPPHKQARDLAADADRIAMLELAIGGHEAFEVSKLELERGGVSYTVETLSRIKVAHPDADLFFLMGADSLVDLPTWHQPSEICRLATPLVVERAGSPPPEMSVLSDLVSEARLREIESHRVKMPIVEISSTDLRQRAQDGRSLRYQLPRAVEKYIEQHDLYRS